MAKAKQYVFSARTTEAGLKALSEVKDHLKIGWDETVIDAISAYYKLDKATLSLPKKEKATEQGQTSEVRPAEAPKKGKGAKKQNETKVEA